MEVAVLLTMVLGWDDRLIVRTAAGNVKWEKGVVLRQLLGRYIRRAIRQGTTCTASF